MPIKKYTTEQIIGLLGDTKILLAEDHTAALASKNFEIAEQTYYRWCKEYGDMKVSHAKRLKNLEKENGQLKKLPAEANSTRRS
jgi:hypothetical protein